VEGGILPAVSQAVSYRGPDNSSVPASFGSPRNTLSSSSGVVIAVNDTQQPQQTQLAPPSTAPNANVQQGPQFTSTGLAFDEEAKLVYGVILSLRNMIKKLSGRYGRHRSAP
jgi:trafficking protein particle complex subunit 1